MLFALGLVCWTPEDSRLGKIVNSGKPARSRGLNDLPLLGAVCCVGALLDRGPRVPVLVAPFPCPGSECLSQPEAAVTWQQGGPPVLVVQGTVGWSPPLWESCPWGTGSGLELAGSNMSGLFLIPYCISFLGC